MAGNQFDFAHSDGASKSRSDKAKALAQYVWDRSLSSDDVLGLSDAVRRKLARAAGLNPPSTMETWTSVAQLLDQKQQWATSHPDHDAAAHKHSDEKIMWVKPPITPWR